MKLVAKAFNSNFEEVPFAVEDGDFTVKIPENSTLSKITNSPEIILDSSGINGRKKS